MNWQKRIFQSISRNKDFFWSNKGTFCFLDALFWKPSEFRFRLFESFDVNAIDFETAESFKSDIAIASRSLRFDLFDFKSSFAKILLKYCSFEFVREIIRL